MNKTTKILLILFFTLLVPVVTLLGIIKLGAAPKPEVIVTSKVIPVYTENRELPRYYENSLEESKDLEARDEARRPSANPDVATTIEDPSDGEPGFTYVPLSDIKNESARRLLDSNKLESPGIIDLYQENNSTKQVYAYRHVFKRLKGYSSKYIVYPYQFNYNPTSDAATAVQFNKGGVFSLDPSAFPASETESGYFKSYAASTDVEFNRAKALYSINIAVLVIDDTFNGDKVSLMSESSQYTGFLKSYTLLYNKVINADEYETFKADSANEGKPVLALITPEQFDFLLTADGAPRFQLLIVSDHITSSHTVINTRVTEAKRAILKDYLNKGGFIYAYGKSGYLLESWGILKSGIYDTNTLITSIDKNAQVGITGCPTISDSTDFETALLCMNTGATSHISNSYKVNSAAATADGLEIVMSLNPSSTNLRRQTLAGKTTALTDDDKAFLPFVMKKSYGHGKVVVVNGNPAYKYWYNTFLYQQLFLAMSRKVMFDAVVGSTDDKPIPGGEVGIRVQVAFSFLNIYDSQLKNANIRIWVPEGLEAVVDTLQDGCSVATEEVAYMNLTAVKSDNHVLCSAASLAAFGKYESKFIAEITDSTLTQVKDDILMAVVGIEYTDISDNSVHKEDVGPLRTDAALAALLRGALNPDPSGFYPILGRGQYVDNVLQLENKEDTLAMNVDYVAVIPLITPIVDGIDQRMLARALTFLLKYYNMEQAMYYLPFIHEDDDSLKNWDYIDFKALNGKGIYLGADWDIPVRVTKRVRAEAAAEHPAYIKADYVDTTGSFDIVNKDYSTKINNKEIVLEQIFFDNADQFFEHATQRLMTYVDTSTVNGANTNYDATELAANARVSDGTIAKAEFLWLRNDIYFYPASEYQMPVGVNRKDTFSEDRYTKYITDVPTYECKDNFGGAKNQRKVEGKFNNTDGLKPHEYYNELFMYCRNIYTFDQITDSEGVKKIKYLVPILDTSVQQVGDIKDFVEGGAEGFGHHKEYTNIIFTRAHTLSFKLSPNISRQGGVLEFNLKTVNFKSGITPVESGYITYSADQIAFYKTEYDSATNTIKSHFKRGLMSNEAYGKDSKLGIMIEGLDSTSTISVHMRIYEMKYDLTSDTLETLIEHADLAKDVNFDYLNYLKMPALELHTKLNRGADSNSSMLPYELYEAYSRIGLYIQELYHRPVYAYPEIHNVFQPGVVTMNTGLASISNVGICSIPYAEYVTTGSGLLIPSSPVTSRVEWTDIWGRRWVQALRSVFPDIPPIPPPLKNFVMTTTYELTKAGTKERVLAWNSDEKLDIRVQLKLLNNYPKYFEITTCKENEYVHFQSSGTMFSNLRIFDDTDFVSLTSSQAPGNTHHISFGHFSKYGVCFQEAGTVLQGHTLSDTEMNNIAAITTCADDASPADLKKCLDQYGGGKTVKMRGENDTKGANWMYSPRVEKYYPENYIKENMWDMTHYDYDDNPMDKAYKYHIDNNLPGIDYGPPQNPSKLKGHNFIAQPIFKGFGYSISYSNNMTLPRFPKYKGWWSDNLQNKDHTLVAGQDKVNDISVDKETLLPNDMWINANDFTDAETKNNVETRLKNIHACMFNQFRVKLSVDQQRYAYLANVFQNNIIPIMPDLDENDDRLTKYVCKGTYQYSPYNISQVDNIVRTGTVRDYLYFEANLRGGALETVNIPYSMSPLTETKFEGFAKVQDGGRFTYWNPVNGPNSFLIVDDPVNVVEAIRCDLTIEAEVIPTSTTTFNGVLYYLLKISDEEELNRKWAYETYTNNYGFGDATTAVFVGGTDDTRATLDPGESTLIKVTFYNNAGFDWNLKVNAIEYKPGTLNIAINAHDLLHKQVHSVQFVKDYKFMELEIPDEIKPYIEIGASDHNALVAPQFFDFMNINVVTIRDGYKGDYYYKLKILSSFPENLRGRVFEIKINLKEECFEKLPSYNDPTKAGYHDYHLSIPSIKFGVKHSSTHPTYPGMVFYTLGYSTDLYFTADLPSLWTIEEGKMITEKQLDEMRGYSNADDEGKTQRNNFWQNIPSSLTVKTTSYKYSTGSSIKLDLSSWYPKFPIQKDGEPDDVYGYIMLKATSAQTEKGSAVTVMRNPKINYKDHKGKAKSSLISAPTYLTASIKGAWLKLTSNQTLVELDENNTYVVKADQRYFAEDTNGTICVDLTATNTGDDNAYNTKLIVKLPEGISLVENMMSSDNSYTITPNGTDTDVSIDVGHDITAGSAAQITIYIHFDQVPSRRRLEEVKSVSFIKSVVADMKLTRDDESTQVYQSINSPVVIAVSEAVRDTIDATIEYDLSENRPTFKIKAVANPNSASITYTVMRRINKLECLDNETTTSQDTCATLSENSWYTLLDNQATCDFTDKPIPDTYDGIISGWDYDFKIFSYNSRVEVAAVSFNYKYSNTEEDELSKEYSLPVYVIIIIVVLTVAIIAVAVILVYRKYKIVKIAAEPSSTTNEVVVSPGH